VAIKVIDRRRIISNPDLITEVSVLKRLEHPNIISLKDVFITPEHLQIVMELYVKRNRTDRWRGFPCSIAAVWKDPMIDTPFFSFFFASPGAKAMNYLMRSLTGGHSAS
jgi:serine/threonine protein kinase